MDKIPGFLKKYFWDVDFSKMDTSQHRMFVLKRILEYGDERAVRWMWRNFKEKEVKDALCNLRGYSSKSANFWALMLNVRKEKVKCLKRSFQRIQKQFWLY